MSQGSGRGRARLALVNLSTSFTAAFDWPLHKLLGAMKNGSTGDIIHFAERHAGRPPNKCAWIPQASMAPRSNAALHRQGRDRSADATVFQPGLSMRQAASPALEL
jgi:hypothetical protein